MSSNGEIIQLHVGQAGVQIANACWELYCLEHGIDAHGYMYYSPNDESFSTFFACSSTPKLVPRVVMVDSEPNVIDEVRTGSYGHLFKPDTLLNGKEDSGSNFARGYNTLGSELIDITMNSIRSVAEDCPNLKGFIAFRSMGGGTGSGLGDRIMERILDEYGKITKMEFIVFPSPSTSPLIVEPYNSLLGAHVGMDASDCTFILDNEALYDICSRKLDVASPTYTNLNRIIGQVISALTAPQRFYGSMNVSFAEFQTNLVPFPRIHFPLVSYAPLVTVRTSNYTQFSTEQLTLECFQPSSQLVRCNPAKGKYMSCVLLYRGNVVPVDINSSIKLMKAKSVLKFVDWSPTGFKIGINSMPPCPVPGGDVGYTDRAVLALSNNTVIQTTWCRLLNKFDHLFKRRAFVHHFLSEGMEEDTFMEASEDICSLISDYREAEGQVDALSRSVTMSKEGMPWRQQFRTHRDEADEWTVQNSCDSGGNIQTVKPTKSKTTYSEHESCSMHGRNPSDISNAPRFEESDDRLSITLSTKAEKCKKHPGSSNTNEFPLSEETGDRVSISDSGKSQTRIQVPANAIDCVSESKRSTVNQEERQQSSADVIASPSSSKSSRLNCHFNIYSDSGSSLTSDHPRRRSTEVLLGSSRINFNFQIQDGIWKVLDNIHESTDDTSMGVTTINCFLNITQGTCTCTVHQSSTKVSTSGHNDLANELSKSDRRTTSLSTNCPQFKNSSLNGRSMIPIPIAYAKDRYSTKFRRSLQNGDSRKLYHPQSSQQLGRNSESTHKIGDHASSKFQPQFALARFDLQNSKTYQRKSYKANSISKPSSLPRSVSSRKSPPHSLIYSGYWQQGCMILKS